MKTDLKPSWATDYFRTPDTVSTWWNPTSSDDPAFRAWFLSQMQDVLAICRPRGQRVLDAATGRGRAAIAAAAADAALVVAADISHDMLALAGEAAEREGLGEAISFVNADLERLPVADGAFDVALLLETLLHLAEPGAVLGELRRALRPGGVLFLTTVGANPASRLLQPAKRGSHPAGRLKLATATAVNLAMTSLFGFTWARSPRTARLYRRLFSAPVRPLPPSAVRRMLTQAGFEVVYHRAVPGTLLPREHRWAALSPH